MKLVTSSETMSSVDKFGRPLPSSSESSRSALAIIEGLHIDSDKQYNARERRIKKLADGQEDDDAVTLKQLLHSIQILKESLTHDLVVTRRKFYDLLDGKMDVDPRLIKTNLIVLPE